MNCPECNQPEQYPGYVAHKLSCGSVSLFSAYLLLRDRSIVHFSEEMLMVMREKFDSEIERRIETTLKGEELE
jgi:hypothetical protein